jgi:hypothetical protein
VSLFGRLQHLIRQGAVLIAMAAIVPACTWFQVTLHPTPFPPTEAEGSEATPGASLTSTSTGLAPTATPIPAASATASRTPHPPAPTPSMTVLLDELEHQVSDLRGLHPLQPIRRVTLPPDSLAQERREGLLDTDLIDQLREVSFTLHLLGLLETDTDPVAYYLRQLDDAPSRAYYQRDSGTGQILLPASGELGLEDSLAYIDAYLSGLLDQHFGALPSRMECPLDLLEADDRLALRALVEGDIALLKEQWMRIYGVSLWRDFGGLYPTAICGSEPPAPSDSRGSLVQFRCQYGLPFVEGLYLDGGWASVDAAYRTPPTSTEALMHPKSQADRAPAEVDLGNLEIPGPDWRQVIQTTLGEWRLQKMLERYLPERSALLASQGWAGDTLRVYADSSHTVGGLVIVILWDTRYDAEEYLQFLQDYNRARFGSPVSFGEDLGWRYRGMVSMMRRSAERTVWLLAPDLETGLSWLESLGFSERGS